ncbi:MAG: branched-chain amino acid ABC transporter permease [Thermodesulfobacteriota bacterium]|jgi:branched-chain amino acid transport system permease protein
MFDITGEAIAQSVLNGFCLGWSYILIAIGLSLIFGIMNILQFAHGEVYMLGSYCVYAFSVMVGLNFFLALIISIALMALLGLFLERFIFRPLGGELLTTLIVSLGLMIILQAGVQVGFGVTPKSYPIISHAAVANIMGMKMAADRLMVVGISIAAILGLFFGLKKTKLGQALIASAQHFAAARLMGINPNHMAATAMAIGSALAAVAGGLMGSIFRFDPFMGGAALLKGLIVVITGGKDSILGVVLAGLLVGLVDGIFPVLFGPAVASIASLVIVVIILLIRPQGFLGHAQ